MMEQRFVLRNYGSGCFIRKWDRRCERGLLFFLVQIAAEFFVMNLFIVRFLIFLP